MIPYEVDPSLHTKRPEAPVLDDGFSPPPPEEEADDDQAHELGTQSEF